MAGPTELLSTIVEFSIGLAGFSGVIGIFMHRSGQLLYVDRFRISNLLIISLTPGFLSFFTLGLLQLSWDPQTTIKMSAGAFALALVGALIVMPRARLKVPEQDKHLVGPIIFVPMAGTFAAILIIQTLIVFSILDTQEFVIYYYCLVLMLFMAVVQFARLILARPEERADRIE